MKTTTLEKRICPFDGEEFTPDRSNQDYCSYECQYTDYNRKKAVRQKRAQLTFNKIIKNWEVLYSIMSEANFEDTLQSEESLLLLGFTPDYFTHMGTDPENESTVYCICEFGYKKSNNKYLIVKIEQDEN